MGGGVLGKHRLLERLGF